MGAERMFIHGFAGLMMWDFGYQPRHRSTRRALVSAGRLSLDGWDDPPFPGDGRPDWPESQTDASWLASPADEPDLLDQLTSDQLRRLLERCALDDRTRNIPELVLAIGHSSHSAATLTSAWREFRQATRDSYALRLRTRRWTEFFGREDLGTHPDEDAVELKLHQADDAWWLITNGLP